MQAYKLIKRKPSVIYRWLRLRRYLIQAVTMACVLAVLPLGIAGGVHISRFISANKALAATNPHVEGETDDLSPHAFGGRFVIEKPGALDNLKGDDLLSLLRMPDLDRREGATRIWQYRSASCVLDIYLSDETGKGAGRVVHYEVRPRRLASFGARGKDANRSDEAGIDSSRCLKEIAGHRA